VGSYFGMGLLGTAAGALAITAMGLFLEEPPARIAIAVLAPVAAFLIAVKLAHILFGFERIVLYEKFAAALALSALAMHLAGQPVRAGLELVTLGVGTFLVFGRLGCLRVGCCHGRPHRRGIVYGDDHARAGFPAHLVGVRLFPVQLVESLVTLGLVALAALMLAFPHRPGEVLVYYFALYGAARFALELIRGDDDRPQALGLSEAQWIALLSAWLGTLAAWRWGLHLRWFYLGLAAALTLGAAAIAVVARREPWRLAHPRALRQLGDGVLRLHAASGAGVARTETATLRLSYSLDGDGREHYALSRIDGTLAEPTARLLAAQIAQLRAAGDPEVVAGRAEGLWHLFVRRA
jgi:hypothetical protein